MPNGSRGDHPLTDILHHKIETFSPTADDLIRHIAKLVPSYRLHEMMEWWSPPPIDEFERQLREMLGKLRQDAKDSGWEIDPSDRY